MILKLPEFALVVLIGASGSGKSTFAKKHFKPTEVISSDYCRGLVSDDENSLEATADAFDVVHYMAAKRLKNMKLTVIDATSVRPEDRKPLIKLAHEHHCLAVAIVLNLPERVSHDRNASRPERDFGPHVVRNQASNLNRGLRNLKREGFRYIYTFKTEEEVNAVTIERQPLWTNRRHEKGPFDIIGDVHGCANELEVLLNKLGYEYESIDAFYARRYFHPEGRKAIFLGDLTDRGPRNLDVYGLVKNMVEAENALCVPGNHDVKLLRKLRGKKVQLNYGLEQTVAELDALDEHKEAFEKDMAAFLDSLISHYVLDDGKLVVAHAGLREDLQGRASGVVRSFSLYGETTGETDEFGLPVRYNWATEYRGESQCRLWPHTST